MNHMTILTNMHPVTEQGHQMEGQNRKRERGRLRPPELGAQGEERGCRVPAESAGLGAAATWPSLLLTFSSR